MAKVFQFGENVEGFNNPVLNEREIRAAAGILFVFMFTAILKVIFTGDFVLLKYAVTIFLVDISIRIFINPRFAPTLILGRLIVRNQVPEYVGAQQKKFAWIIGFVLAMVMFVLQVVVNTYSPITGMICFICLIFLIFEAAFGICLGCKVYPLIYGKKAQYCPGEVCDVKDRQNIQRTSTAQFLIVLAFIGFIFLTVFLVNDFYVEPPQDLFAAEQTVLPD